MDLQTSPPPCHHQHVPTLASVLSEKEMGPQPRLLIFDVPAPTPPSGVPSHPLVLYESSPGVYHKFRRFNSFDGAACTPPPGAVLRAPSDRDTAWLREEVYDYLAQYYRLEIVPEYMSYLSGTHKVYQLHDNGGTSFVVYVSSDVKPIVTAYVLPHSLDLRFSELVHPTIEHFTKMVYRAQAQEVWVGNNTKNRLSEWAGCDTNCDGNSLLIRLSGLTYVYLGMDIFSFEAYTPITALFSPVGNNDVAYPHAVDAEGFTYLLQEDIVLTQVPAKWVNDPYNFFYEKKLRYGVTRADFATLVRRIGRQNGLRPLKRRQQLVIRPIDM